ncbi:hypothetical protein ACTA71_004992 [Dictyostelium dimigraforme]
MNVVCIDFRPCVKLIHNILKFKPKNLIEILAKRTLDIQGQRGKLVEYLILISNTRAWIPFSLLLSYTKEVGEFSQLVKGNNQLKQEVIDHWNQYKDINRLFIILVFSNKNLKVECCCIQPTNLYKLVIIINSLDFSTTLGVVVFNVGYFCKKLVEIFMNKWASKLIKKEENNFDNW